MRTFTAFLAGFGLCMCIHYPYIPNVILTLVLSGYTLLSYSDREENKPNV